MSPQNHSDSRLAYEKVKMNEWRLFICLFLSAITQPQKIISALIPRILQDNPFVFNGSTRSHIILASLINPQISLHQNDVYLNLYHLSKATGMQFDVRCGFQRIKCAPEDFGYSREEIEKAWYSKENQWNILFDRVVHESVLQKIQIPDRISLEIKTPPNQEILNAMIDEYVRIFIEAPTACDNFMTYKKQRNILLQKIMDIYEMKWDMVWLTLRERIFEKYEGFSLIYCMAMLWRMGYVNISNIESIESDIESTIPIKNQVWIALDRIATGEVSKINTLYTIHPTDEFKKVLEWYGEIRDIILDKLFDERYKQISITRKWWTFHMLEGEIEIIWDDIKFTTLKNKYPHSNITATNYNGKTTVYKIKEKTKLDR